MPNQDVDVISAQCGVGKRTGMGRVLKCNFLNAHFNLFYISEKSE
jgi:hypothetical protein